MPINESWDGVELMADSDINQETVACCKAALALLHLEQAGYIRTGIQVQKDSLTGIYYRSLRLKVPQPSDDQIVHAFQVLIEKVASNHVDSHDSEVMQALVRTEAIPAVKQELEP